MVVVAIYVVLIRGVVVSISIHQTTFTVEERDKERSEFAVLNVDDNPEGIVLGARPTERPTKRIIAIEDSDEIVFSYYLSRFVDLDDDSEVLNDDEIWFDGDPYIIWGEMIVENWEVDEGTYLYGFLIEDSWGNECYTDFIEVNFDY